MYDLEENGFIWLGRMKHKEPYIKIEEIDEIINNL